MPLPLAMLGAQAGLSALGGLLGGRGAKRAARRLEQGYAEAGQLTAQGYDRAGNYLGPRYQQERGAMARVNALLGLPGGDGADPTAVLRSTPGYQFQMDQGRQAIERSAAAGGGVVSGNTLTELTRFGQGLADTTFNNYLAQVMGLQNQGVDNALAGMSIDRGNTLANYRLGAAGARASGVEQGTNALVGGLSGAAGAIGQYQGNQLLAQILRR